LIFGVLNCAAKIGFDFKITHALFYVVEQIFEKMGIIFQNDIWI